MLLIPTNSMDLPRKDWPRRGVLHRTVLHHAMLHHVMLHHAMLHVLCCTVLCCIMLCCAMLCCTCCAALCCAIQHNNQLAHGSRLPASIYMFNTILVRTPSTAGFKANNHTTGAQHNTHNSSIIVGHRQSYTEKNTVHTRSLNTNFQNATTAISPSHSSLRFHIEQAR